MRLLFCLLLTLLARAAWSLAPGDYRFDLDHDGRQRSYLVHVPPQAADGRPLPAIVNFHGGGGSAAAHERFSGMDGAADRHGFIAVYPNGSGRLPGRLLTWNAGNCCGYAQQQGIDDIGFSAAVLDDLASRMPVDARRIYVTGMSNGGMMAHRLAEGLPERIAAAAPVAGTHVPGGPAAARAVPILHIHSIDDPRALYAGGLGPPFPFTQNRIPHQAVEETLAAWAARDRCAAAPTQAERRTGTGGDAGVTATRLVWSGCRDGAEVSLWKLTGAGHVWPGADSKGLERLLGRSTRIIDANEEMWRFFSRFSLPR